MRARSDSSPTAVVLGASHWHAPLYVDALSRSFRVLAVQDADPRKLLPLGTALNAPVIADVDEALSAGPLDAAFVFSPHHEMLAIGRKLIDRGVPFVIEKPAGRNLDELRSLEETARAAGVAVTVPLVQRAAPIDLWLRQAGDIVYERMAFVAGPPGRYRRSGNPWMLDPLLSGGGSLMNLGPHFVDMAISHIGPPADVVKRESSARHGEAVDDHSTLVLTTDAGREAIIEVGYAFPDSPLKRYCSFSAAGSNGFATVETSGRASFTATDGTTIDTILEVDSDPLYGVFVDKVAASLADGFTGMPTLTDLRRTMEIIWRTPSPRVRDPSEERL